MYTTDKSPWEKMNMYLAQCVYNATNYSEHTNIVYELNNLLCSFAKPGMLERDIVTEVEKLLHKHMRELGDPIYQIKGI